jgi:hypothetical protein
MTVLEQLAHWLPDVRLEPGPTFYWSPRNKHIAYSVKALERQEGIWALLHEAGHALLNHQTYRSDFELLAIEVAAWERAKALAKDLNVVIGEDHIQDCLDTYRDWLHRRSLCPTCGTVSLQHPDGAYACHNCPAQWHVTPAKFCRPYRRLSTAPSQAGKPAVAIFR